MRNPQDGVLFTPWWWDELKEAGIKVGIVDLAPRAVIYEEMTRAAKQEDPDPWADYDPWEGIEVARPPDWKSETA